MISYNFSYDNIELDDFGFMICDFDGGSGSEVVSAGSKITFNTVPMHKGKKHSLTSTQYDECITATFSICKKNCSGNDENMKITNDEYRDIMRWLNRREYLRFQIFDEDDNFRDACFYEASFNVQKILIGGLLYGLELTLETNKPFGYGEEQVFLFDVDDISTECVVYDSSDEIGYIYPNLVITCKTNGELKLINELMNSEMIIRNCKENEVITVYGKEQILVSDNEDHNKTLYDDFEFEFLRIGNTFENNENIITTTLPCILEVRYEPIIKDSPEY